MPCCGCRAEERASVGHDYLLDRDGGAGGIVAGLLLVWFLHNRAWADVPWLLSGVVAGWCLTPGRRR